MFIIYCQLTRADRNTGAKSRQNVCTCITACVREFILFCMLVCVNARANYFLVNILFYHFIKSAGSVYSLPCNILPFNVFVFFFSYCCSKCNKVKSVPS